MSKTRPLGPLDVSFFFFIVEITLLCLITHQTLKPKLADEQDQAPN